MSHKPTVYFDYAAATPLDERVFAAMEPFFASDFYNPSSPYLAAKRVKSAIAQAKGQLGRCIGAKPTEIIMTAGATESINLAIWGILSRFPDAEVVTTAIEHPAVLEAAKRHKHHILPVLPSGLLQVDSLRLAITDQTVLVSVGYVNNELGTVQPLKQVAQLLQQVRQDRLKQGNTLPLYLHSDASQAAGYFELHVSRLGVDLLTLNAAKCYGPKQTGLLWVKPGVKLSPLIVGGGQEQNLRSGTESPANVIGFATALQLAETNRKEEAQRVQNLRDNLQKAICDNVAGTLVNGSAKRRSPNHLHLAWPGIDAERVLYALDDMGVMVATGSACAANKGTRSHVLTAVGMSPEVADGSIRITLGTPTTADDVTYGAEAIVKVIKKELARG